MSTAYLTHQISELESKINKASINHPQPRVAGKEGFGGEDDIEFPPLGTDVPKSRPRQSGQGQPRQRHESFGKGGVVGGHGRIWEEDDSHGPDGNGQHGQRHGRRRGDGGGEKERGRIDDSDLESRDFHASHHRGSRGTTHGKRWSSRLNGRFGDGQGYGDSNGDEGVGGDGDGDPGRAWKVVVVDSSALLWAPQAVKRLVGQGWEVIVPVEGESPSPLAPVRLLLDMVSLALSALRTLDLLKSGSSPSARAARASARYIEHASRHHRPISSDPSILVQSPTLYKRGRGLRLQHDGETRSPDTVSTLSFPPSEMDGIPKWMDNVLGCAAYFVGIAAAEIPPSRGQQDGNGEDRGVGGHGHGLEHEHELEHEHVEVDQNLDLDLDLDDNGAVLYIANPPLSVEVKEKDVSGLAERGEGYLISQEAERIEIPLEVLRDEEDDTVPLEGEGGGGRRRERGRGGRGGGDRRGGRGRGGGKGGRRGDRGGDESSEREVKILLRRPTEGEAETGGGSPTIPAPHLSSPSTANRSPLVGNNDLNLASSGQVNGVPTIQPRIDSPRLSIPSPQIPPSMLSSGPRQLHSVTVNPVIQPDPSQPQIQPPRGMSSQHPRPPPLDHHAPFYDYNPRPGHPFHYAASDRDQSDEDPMGRGHGRGSGRGGRGRGGPGRGGARGGGRGRGRGGRGGGGGGDFVLLQRPGPPLATGVSGGGPPPRPPRPRPRRPLEDEDRPGPSVVLLQRPK